MRRYVLFALVLTMVGSLALLTAQNRPRVEGKRNKLAMMRQASTMTVENLEDGVLIKVTSSDPNVVEMLQQEWAKRAESWNSDIVKPAGTGGALKRKGDLERKEERQSDRVPLKEK